MKSCFSAHLGWLHDSKSLYFGLQLLSKLYFTVKVEDGEALITEDGGRQCLRLLDNGGLGEASYLLDWLLIFFLSPSWPLSNVTWRTFASFRLGGRTQLQRKPSYLEAKHTIRNHEMLSNCFFLFTRCSTWTWELCMCYLWPHKYMLIGKNCRAINSQRFKF